MNSAVRAAGRAAKGWAAAVPWAAFGVFMVAGLCGATARAQFSVSDSGAPTYGHAIAVPPGVAGMSPKIGLVYGGGGVNGPVGYAWSVQGISSITRCPATIATDGKKAGVGYVADDKLCLDGQRLIQIDTNGSALVGSGTNDATGLATSTFHEYRTETDNYARIRSYGYANGDSTGASGPAFFKVWTKAGQVVEYGDSPSKDPNTKALVNAQGQSIGMVWAVARINDVRGNYVDFKYEQRDVAWGSSASSGHEWNLSEVQYSGNKVVFAYVDRAATSPQDAAEAYNRGFKNISVRRLQSITTYTNSPNTDALGAGANAVAIKTTKLSYDNGPITKRSRLTKIQECAGGPSSTRCMPAITFTYAPGGDDAYATNAAFSQSSLSTLTMLSPTGTYGVIVGDFDGDGKTDLIRWSDNPAENQLWLSNGDGTFTQATSFTLQGVNLFKSDGCYVSTVTDINGDGLPDIVRYSGPTSASGATCATYGSTFVYANNGDGTFTQLTYSGPTLTRNSTANFYLFDFNGDGKVDLVTSLAGSFVPYTCPAGMSCTPRIPAYKCTDASGVCTHVFRGNGNGSFTEIPTNIGSSTVYDSPVPNSEVNTASRVGDLDGDGLTDLGGWRNDSGQGVKSYRSRGDGNFDAYSDYGCTSPIDFNGDGRADCLGAIANYAQRLSLGSGGSVSNFNLTGAGQELAGAGIGFVVADVNGDGRQDIFRWKDDATQNVLYLSNGDGTFSTSSTFNLSGTQLKKSDSSVTLTTGDFTGRGNVEILRLQTIAGVTTNRLFVKQDSTPPDQLLTVTSGSGASVAVYYVPLANPLPAPGSPSASLGARYFGDRGTANASTFPMVDLTLPTYVVSTIVSDAGVGANKINTEFGYRGLKADAQGRGLLGFREVLQQSVGPDGSALTQDKQYLQVQPYIGAVASTATYNRSLNAVAAVSPLSKSVNVYCDQTAAAGADTAAVNTKVSCTTAAKIQRPYLLLSTQTSQDLNGAILPTVTTQTAVNATGDPTSVVATTTGSVAGVAQSFVKTVTNLYNTDITTCSADGITCSWILGRLQRATVNNVVPNSLPSIATSAGGAANATATVGTTPAGKSWPLSPAQLAVIIDLLLSD